jgi:hypothetical protein
MAWRNDVEQTQVVALSAAGRLAGYLRAGGVPQPLPCSVRLDPGEVCFGEGAVGLSRYGAWAGQPGPQWHSAGVVPLVATSRRLLACLHGRWLSWWYTGVRQLVPDVAGLSLAVLFDDQQPARFEGAFAPWLAVLLTRLLYGEILEPGPEPFHA